MCAEDGKKVKATPHTQEADPFVAEGEERVLDDKAVIVNTGMKYTCSVCPGKTLWLRKHVEEHIVSKVCVCARVCVVCRCANVHAWERLHVLCVQVRVRTRGCANGCSCRPFFTRSCLLGNVLQKMSDELCAARVGDARILSSGAQEERVQSCQGEHERGGQGQDAGAGAGSQGEACPEGPAQEEGGELKVSRASYA